MSSEKDAEGPPEAPRTERRLRFGKLQLPALVVIALIPIAALTGAFGESWAYAEATTSELSIRMRYPDRYRYKQINRFEIFIENRSDAVLDTVTVAFDTAYVLGFSQPVFLPDVTEPFTVPVTAVRPGETRLVTATLQGERPWVHEGEVRITSGGPDTVRIPVRTIIFP